MPSSTCEARTQELGRRLVDDARRRSEHLSLPNRWTKQLLSWCLDSPQVKAQVLRFLDVLPVLRTPAAVAQHLHDYFPAAEHRLPLALRAGASIARPGLLTAPAVSAVVHRLIEQVAAQFIAGTDAAEAAAVCRRLTAQGWLISLDVLGEAVISDEEADRMTARYQRLIQELGPAAGAEISVKPSSLAPRFDPLSFEENVGRALARLRPLARAAADAGIPLTLDMEQYELRDLTLELAMRLLDDAALSRLRLGIVLQAYLSDTESLVPKLLERVSAAGRPLTIRLVKGAYWDYEVARAKQMGWTIPVYLEKWQTDAAFERLTRRLLAASPTVRTAVASHNLRSIAHAMACAEDLHLAPDAMEFQVLYGMGDVLQAVVRDAGYPVRLYAPLGALIPGMAYLVRRVLENTANESFLRQDLWERLTTEEVLRPPAPHPTRARPVAAGSGVPHEPEEPLANFSQEIERRRLSDALSGMRRSLGQDYPLLIGGQAVRTERTVESRNPAHPEELIGRAACAGPEEAARAVEVASQAQAAWARLPGPDRAARLHRAAQGLRQHRAELTALITLEVGKPWREADAEVVEAIEYLGYYARRYVELIERRALGQRPGERNRQLYLARGVCAVIAPWNFPLAILLGMASAALVTGHAVILKPAEQSFVIAAWAARLLRDAGIPPGIIQYLPGRGEEIGPLLVRHPEVGLVMFTGSKAVGLSILQDAAQVRAGQRRLKQVIVEMGGKNAIIVDEDADLDEAVQGILASAFGYAGQKCSAASRLIMHEAVFDIVMARLSRATDRLVVGDPAHPGCDVGPLIDAEAQRRLQDALSQARRDGTVMYEYPASRLPTTGYFVSPALVSGVDPNSRLAQEELFGPLVCCFRVKNIEEALALANDSDYGLTGGIYSRSPSHIQAAIEGFEVGNFYINRPITGAMVGRQPFGGCKLSGLGTKAGGPDYLTHLVIPKTICENTARHGMPLE
ncbi:MAG: bifunctional proline dehydrogenase/L-glutamate gamma-semialdehyde dehydrogenase [Candidatus Omnitrophica bacterium]|nr:bifunctional proline dehydrogenase/L-glutamate gamma-semialdehyde dehydrogenase [Candidatus Omnitrophota bacterium]